MTRITVGDNRNRRLVHAARRIQILALKLTNAHGFRTSLSSPELIVPKSTDQ
jgi:hypothetical protein